MDIKEGVSKEPKLANQLASLSMSRRESTISSGTELSHTNHRKTNENHRTGNIILDSQGPLMWYTTLYGGDEDKEPGMDRTKPRVDSY